MQIKRKINLLCLSASVLLCFFSSVLLCLCASVLLYPPPPAFAKPPPSTESECTQAETLSEKIREQNPFASLSAYVQVNLQVKKKTQSFDVALLLESPDKLHLEILDDLGQVHYRIIADGSQILWHDAQANRYTLLEQDEKALKKILKLPLTVTEFIQRMLLQIPEEKKTKDKKFLYCVRYGNFTSLEFSNTPGTGNFFPQIMDWEFKKPKITMHLELSAVEINVPFSPEKFDTTPPPGAALGKIH